MIINELFDKLNTEKAAEIFSELYGRETGEARGRYKSLVTEIFEIKNHIGSLRVFTAPGRTELAGNHTDHNNGKVLAASIHLDCAAVVRMRSDNVIFYRSTGFPDVEVKLTDANGAFALQPKPEEKGKTEALIRGIAAELQKRGCKIGGFSANADSKVFPGSGLSSSAALEVLIGRILDSLYDEGKRTALEIAQIGQIAENEYFGKPCGLMDQVACATGGAVAIDFADNANPIVKQINFDPSAAGYTLCVVNTGGSHADLTADYAAIPSEMKAIASFFGKNMLREIEKEFILKNEAVLIKTCGERAYKRAVHFFDENDRVSNITNMLLGKKYQFNQYLNLISESGESSKNLLQNIYPSNGTSSLGSALDFTKKFFDKEGLQGICRVHGGGFAGTIQVYIPKDSIDSFQTHMEMVYGKGSVTPLRIRKQGAIELEF